MSTPSTDLTTAVVDGGPRSADQPPVDIQQAGSGDRLYRIIWRWHFYAGMLIAPWVIVVAATGGLYIFKDELEAVVHPGVTWVEPTSERTSYEQQIAAAWAAVPGTQKTILMYVFNNPKRATSMVVAPSGQYVYVDPYRGKYLGVIGRNSFFDKVLDLHRTLFWGSTGRIIVELATCWTIVLAATGIYLWWPRKWNQVWGVWLPRLRQKPYVILRDLHSVGGIYVAIIAIVIALTGLIYSFSWGRAFQYASKKYETFDMFSKSMTCKSPPDAKDLPVDRIIEIAQQKMPGSNLTVWFPRIPNGVFLVTATNDRGPQFYEMSFIDRASGEILEHRYLSQTKILYQVSTWNYALHVGSLWGLPTKYLWLVTCVILMTLPVTGIWMWWQRRPKGRLGLPRRVDAWSPLWLIATVAATSILLPTVGVSVVVFVVCDLLMWRLRKQ